MNTESVMGLLDVESAYHSLRAQSGFHQVTDGNSTDKGGLEIKKNKFKSTMIDS
jgi:hypothetical protein